MNEIVLKTHNLTKRYKNKAAVDNISIGVQKGDIYGLIGRNGAGKTTLIRMVTALTVPDGGEIQLFGATGESALGIARKRIGCVVEIPALYPNLSAEQNLEYYRILRGITDKGVVKSSLKKVGLTDTGNKRFKNFSLGMKQRLGIALALLNNPDFIILDEPINGLDPMGIVEMRETFKELNKEHGITLMISSHILNELSLIANRYGIINNGKLIKELTNDELSEQCQKSIMVKVDDTAKSATIIETVLKTNKYKVVRNNEIRIYDYLNNPAEVNYQLVSNGIRVSNVSEIGENLEDYFIWLVGEGK